MPLGVTVPAQDTRTFVRSEAHGLTGFSLLENFQDAADIPAGWVRAFYQIGQTGNAAAAARLQELIDFGFKAVLVLGHRHESNIVYDTVTYASAAAALAAKPSASFPAVSNAVLNTQLAADLALIDPGVNHFIICNKIQANNNFWQGTLAQYTAFYSTIRGQLQTQVPGSKVSVCGVADGIITAGIDGNGLDSADSELIADPDSYMSFLFGSHTSDFINFHFYRDPEDIPAKFAYIRTFSNLDLWVTELGTPDPRFRGYRDDNAFNELNVTTAMERMITLFWAQVPPPKKLFTLRMVDQDAGSAFGEMGLLEVVTNRWGTTVNPRKRLYNIWRDECFRTRP